MGALEVSKKSIGKPPENKFMSLILPWQALFQKARTARNFASVSDSKVAQALLPAVSALLPTPLLRWFLPLETADAQTPAALPW